MNPCRCRALLVGGSPQASSSGLLAQLASEADLVVAVDRGADACRSAGVTPQIFCGDADTVSPDGFAWVRSLGITCDLHAPEKDETDLELALRLVGERRAGSVVATCVSGGSPDHALAVYGVLARHAELMPQIVEDGVSCWILSPNGREHLDLGEADVGARCSVMALAHGTVASVTGFVWDLVAAPLDVLSDLGVSNKVVEPRARIACEAGVLAAFLFED